MLKQISCDGKVFIFNFYNNFNKLFVVQNLKMAKKVIPHVNSFAITFEVFKNTVS